MRSTHVSPGCIILLMILSTTIRLELAHALADAGKAAAALDEARGARAMLGRMGIEHGAARAAALVERLGASAPAGRARPA